MRNHVLLVVFLSLACLALESGAAAPPGCEESWFDFDNSVMAGTSPLSFKEEKSEDGINVYSSNNVFTDWQTFLMNSTFSKNDFTLAQLRDVLWTHNVDRNGEWSKSFVKGRVLENLSADSDVLLMEYSAWPLSSRDFCYVRCKKELPNGGMMMTFRSLDSSRAPCNVEASTDNSDSIIAKLMGGTVRGTMIDCAERIEVREHDIVVTYVLKTDTGGLLPKFVSNMANVKVMFKEFTELHKVVNG
eukprot:GFYU01005467.1.p1 GENE.GFYU01005467.1~~GFYU01005467.1.p1  ORF type:complete len:245 (-),score=29.96 GFYU01005467.1:69-803(-)